MQQYNSIKAKYPDAMLLFRVGDFYETLVMMLQKLPEYSELCLPKEVPEAKVRPTWPDFRITL